MPLLSPVLGWNIRIQGMQTMGIPTWRPTEEEEGEEKIRIFLMCPRIMLSSIHLDQSCPQPYKIALTLSRVVLLN